MIGHESVCDMVAQRTDDPNTKAIYIRERFILPRRLDDPETKEVSSGIIELTSMIANIDGVVGVSLGAYHVIVTKTPLYAWESVLGQVKPVIEHYVKSQQELRRVDTEVDQLLHDLLKEGR